MRDRLIELLLETETFTSDYSEQARRQAEYKADYLLANGVIVPPCKAGESLYQIVDMPYTVCQSFVSSFPIVVEEYSIVCKNILGGYSRIPFEEFGKTVFLTREDAEQALSLNSSKEVIL